MLIPNAIPVYFNFFLISAIDFFIKEITRILGRGYNFVSSSAGSAFSLIPEIA
jgi:hypothetical protein